MTFAQAIKTCFAKYADGTGRATRSEFWYFYLFYVIVWGAVRALPYPILGGLGIFYFFKPVMEVALIIPNIAASVRRMHDIDKSGWFVLIPIYNLILLATPSTVGPNRFGPDASGAATWAYPSLQNEAMTGFNSADPNQARTVTYVQTRKKRPLGKTGAIMLGLSPVVAFSPLIIAAIGAQLTCNGGISGADESNCGFAALPWAMIATIPAGIMLAIAGVIAIIVGLARRK